MDPADILEVGLMGVGVIFLAKTLGAIKTPSVPNLPSLPGLTTGLPGSGAPTTPSTAQLCAGILWWRQNVAPGGFLGIGASDPNDWNAFVSYNQDGGWSGPPLILPATPPDCWWNNGDYEGQKPGGLGY